MLELDKLIEEKKKDYVVGKEELDKRIENRLVHYNMIMPPVNVDDILYKRVRKHYQNLQSLLIDSASRLSGSYTLDATASRASPNGFTIVYLKDESLQKADLVKIKKEEKILYQDELNKAKAQWIETLTTNQAAEATALAKAQAAQSILDLQAELSKLLTSK
jgi:hypothetical protein